MFAEDEAALLADAPGDLDSMVARRVAGEPLEYILGWAEFCGLRVFIEPGVFVPRQRTALMVREAVMAAPASPVVVDLCCGSGAVGAAVAAALSDVTSHAADLDPAAVSCARRNVTGAVHQGDLYDALPPALRCRIDLLLANVPYVPTEAIASMPPEARDHEAAVALDGGPDGLDVFRRVVVSASDWLAPGGSVFLETSAQQVSTAVETLSRAGLTARVATDDEIGATVVIGVRPTRSGPRPGRPAGS
ncbi:release factor glutamine methyltransferase [Actinocrispum wychmicini]|uniref:peptide chain release factor N(5)-glutamine methyltransferase n=1 Tax=Actinocrispum wychmicini TaxID=1213861 RepID=A0A4V2S942_9PSEU|nr:release factor glutamine methyltransferase [Actinocrispum wychmicini]